MSIKDILDKDGVWILEQSYLPLLIKNNAYDSICHEHLSYFMYRQIKKILDKFEMFVFDATFNYMNGGSVRLFISHKSAKFKINKKNIKKIITIENKIFINFYKVIDNFKKSIFKSRNNLVNVIKKINQKKKNYSYIWSINQRKRYFAILQTNKRINSFCSREKQRQVWQVYTRDINTNNIREGI